MTCIRRTCELCEVAACCMLQKVTTGIQQPRPMLQHSFMVSSGWPYRRGQLLPTL